MILLHAINLAFAKISIGIHTVRACIAVSAVCVLLSFLLRRVPGTIMPFEVLFIGILSLIITQPLYGMMKFIPVKDKRTGQTKTWALGT